MLTLTNLNDVYMEIFLPSEQAAKIKDGAEARLTIDALPGVAVAGYVSFVSPEAQFTPKQVETKSEREKLMFRVKIRVPEKTVETDIDRRKNRRARRRLCEARRLRRVAGFPQERRGAEGGLSRSPEQETRPAPLRREPQLTSLNAPESRFMLETAPDVIKAADAERAGRVGQERDASLRQDAGARRSLPRHPERAHGRRHRTGRRGQIDAAGAHRRLQEDAAGQGDRARRRHRRRAPPARRLPAHRLYAPGPRQEPLFGAQRRRRTSTSWRGSSASPPRSARLASRSCSTRRDLAPFPGPPRGQALRRHEAEGQSLRRACP